MRETKSLFLNKNVNPKGNRDADCVVRALTTVLESDWDTVYQDLCELGFEKKLMPNSDDVWKEYAIRNGMTHYKLPKAQKGESRLKVHEFAKENPKGSYILKIANHLVAVVDGTYIDTWDCGHRAVYGYWEKVR